MKAAEAMRRANSHIRYWRYRRTLNNGGPTLHSGGAVTLRRVRITLS